MPQQHDWWIHWVWSKAKDSWESNDGTLFKTLWSRLDTIWTKQKSTMKITTKMQMMVWILMISSYRKFNHFLIFILIYLIRFIDSLHLQWTTCHKNINRLKMRWRDASHTQTSLLEAWNDILNVHYSWPISCSESISLRKFLDAFKRLMA